MAGELFNRAVQIGKETQYGTPVAATRVLYARDPSLTRTREPREHRFSTRDRQTLRKVTLGPALIGGSLVVPVSAELLELLAIGVEGGVTPVGVGADKVWTYTAGGALDSATIEYHDGARPWQAAGVYADTLTFAGDVSGENLCTAELFGAAMEPKALTPGLSEGEPDVFEGWETRCYIDPAGATAGTTEVAGTLHDWSVVLRNNLVRKYGAANTKDPREVSPGEIAVEASFGLWAQDAAALAEYENWDENTPRVIRLEFGGNRAIAETEAFETVALDIAGYWSAVDLGQENEGSRLYGFSLLGVYDPALEYAFRVVVTTARAAAFADRTA